MTGISIHFGSMLHVQVKQFQLLIARLGISGLLAGHFDIQGCSLPLLRTPLVGELCMLDAATAQQGSLQAV